MSRRQYSIRYNCAAEGCREWYYTIADTRAEEREVRQRYSKRPWRCLRHTSPDEVLSLDNPERTTVAIVARPREGASYLTWEGTGSSIVSGPGFKAWADDFPPGTRLVVTARVEQAEA